MILGVGNDLTDIRRVKQSLERYGARFETRLFTQEERAKAKERALPAHTYAKRFAAKEATSKALGTGINQGVYFKDMGVVNLPSGKPTMVLTGGAKAHFDAMIPAGMKGVIHVSITDDYPYAQAFVVIEAV